ncbi:MAG: trimethylamine methyltransferase family protein, partial [Eubacterium sp.]|nr:trimethylamine methyltransferase family protein [Eubacterium sp.]
MLFSDCTATFTGAINLSGSGSMSVAGITTVVSCASCTAGASLVQSGGRLSVGAGGTFLVQAAVSGTGGSITLGDGASWIIDSQDGITGSFFGEENHSVTFSGSATLTGGGSFGQLVFVGDDAVITSDGNLVVSKAVDCSGRNTTITIDTLPLDSEDPNRKGNDFSRFVMRGASSTITFTGANSFPSDTSSEGGGLVVAAPDITLSFNDKNRFDMFLVTEDAMNASVTFDESNDFTSFSVLGAGSTVAFGPEMTQTITDAFSCIGTEIAPVTLTSTDDSASVSDTTTWWIINVEVGAISETDFRYTNIEFSSSVKDISHEWAASVTEKTACSTENWFLTYFWLGSESDAWETAANWGRSADGAAVTRAPSSNGFEKIVIATASGGSTLKLSDDTFVATLVVQSGKTIDLAEYSLTAVSITNNGTVRLKGATSSAAQTVIGAITAGEDSAVSYYGVLVTSLPWDDDAAEEGIQCTNLVFEAGSSATVTTGVSVSGNCTNSGVLTLATDLTVSGTLENHGTIMLSGGNRKLTFGAYERDADGNDSIISNGGTITATGAASSSSAGTDTGTAVALSTLNVAGQTTVAGISGLTVAKLLKVAYLLTVSDGGLTLSADATGEFGYAGSVTSAGSQQYNGSLLFTKPDSVTSDTSTLISDGTLLFSDVSIVSGKTLVLGPLDSAYEVTVTGSWQNSGTLSARKSTVTFTGAAVSESSVSGTGSGSGSSSGSSAASPAAVISGDTTFYNLTCASPGGTLTVSGTQTVSGVLTLSGEADNALTVTGSGAFVAPAASFSGNFLLVDAGDGTCVQISETAGGVVGGIFACSNSMPLSSVSGEGPSPSDYASAFKKGWNLGSFMYTWTGASSQDGTDWADEANWDVALVPGDASLNTTGASVTIPAGAPAYPVNGSTAYSLESLSLSGDGASLTLTDGAVSVTGTDADGAPLFTNEGTVTYRGSETVTDGAVPINDTSHDGWIVYAGSGQSVPSIGAVDYANLRIESAVTLSGDITVSGALETTAAITGAGNALSVSGPATLGADITGSAGQSYAAGVTLSQDVTLSSSGADSAISFAGAVTGSFALTLDAGSGAVSFDGAVGTEESPLGAVVCAGSGSYTFSGAVYASAFSLTASGAQLTLLEDDTFGTLSLTGAGSTARFGAGKTQTVTTALISTGAAGSPVTLTTAAS